MDRIAELFRSIQKTPAGPPTHLIVGLGNPGKEYEGTRHNVGFAAIDCIAEACGTRLTQLKFRALCGDATLGGGRVLMMKPSTYMNLSGEAVAEALAYYKIPPENMIVLCDDVNFAPGIMRIRRKGSHGGHNGLRNITERCGTADFPRIKIGVGQKPHPDYDLADWVLGHFSEADGKLLAALYPSVCEAVKLMLTDRTEEAMRLYSK